jgi:hypothetical protein
LSRSPDPEVSTVTVPRILGAEIREAAGMVYRVGTGCCGRRWQPVMDTLARLIRTKPTGIAHRSGGSSNGDSAPESIFNAANRSLLRLRRVEVTRPTKVVAQASSLRLALFPVRNRQAGSLHHFRMRPLTGVSEVPTLRLVRGSRKFSRRPRDHRADLAGSG